MPEPSAITTCHGPALDQAEHANATATGRALYEAHACSPVTNETVPKRERFRRDRRPGAPPVEFEAMYARFGPS